MHPPPDFDAFRALSARLGQDPMQIQGPGGNTSIKAGDTLWIKASGTELAHAQTQDIFLPVSRPAALAEALGKAGDGSCESTVLNPNNTLRPSIETTFHAALDWPLVAHTHSIATLVHAICAEGRELARDKLADLPVAFVPYAKPGLPLTREILVRATAETRVFVLENHGLIVCGATVKDTQILMEDVETRLAMMAASPDLETHLHSPPAGYDWAAESWIAFDDRAAPIVRKGSYYPDHVVFLGPALPNGEADSQRPAVLIERQGVAIRADATRSQRAMLRCLSDVMLRLPADWTPVPIGTEAEASLLDWDAEKYRQALAARK